MFAVVDILGQQFRVTENTKYYVPRLKAEVDSEVEFDSVLLLNDDKETIGPNWTGLRFGLSIMVKTPF